MIFLDIYIRIHNIHNINTYKNTNNILKRNHYDTYLTSP